MGRRNTYSNNNKGKLSRISAAFIENSSFIRKFLARYFSEKQDIEDVAQEAYLRAFVAEKEKEIEYPKAFLFRVAKNVALTRLAKKTNQISDYIEETSTSIVLDTEPSAMEEAEALELFEIYCDTVVLMPKKCRQVFLLRKVHGLAHRDIAEIMGLSISSVEKYLRQGLLMCKAAVGEQDSQKRQHADSKNEVPGTLSK